MGADYFSLAVPLIVFTVLLLDIKRQVKESSSDLAIKKFRLVGVIVVLALVVSVLLGLMEILGLSINERLVEYSKTFNLIVLIAYLILTRFKRR